MTLVLALSYSAKWEIIEAVKAISTNVKNGTLEIDQIDDELIKNHLSTKHIPDPELMIRTSGEHRISNFLLYQLAEQIHLGVYNLIHLFLVDFFLDYLLAFPFA